MEETTSLIEEEGVLAFQVCQEQQDHKNNYQYEKHNDCEDDIEICYYERHFPIGSLFSFPVQASLPSLALSKDDAPDEEEEDDDDDLILAINPATIRISSGTNLHIHTVSLDPIQNNSSSIITATSNQLSLYVSTDANPDYLCLCPMLSHPNHNLVTSLGLNISGPAEIQFSLLTSSSSSNNGDMDDQDDNNGTSFILPTVNLFGSVQKAHLSSIGTKSDTMTSSTNSIINQNDCELKPQPTSKTIKQTSIPKKKDTQSPPTPKKQVSFQSANDTTPKDTKSLVVGKTAATDSICSSGTENQKNNNTNNDNNISIQNDQNLETPVEKLSKKERRKLAKQKEKELQQALLQDRGVITTTTSNGNETTKTNKTNSTQKISLTKQRSLPGGLLIRDIIHGTGASVQTGRKVSINYTGSFPDTGKIFDKNTSSKNPLVFRVGTGMVIKGLERGLEGMKVGGERIITIPPELGYGKKGTGGAGGIPPNAILTFEVKLVSVGGKG